MRSSSKKPRPDISTTFAEGRYFDLWMLVHALTGFAGGLSNVFFGLPPIGVYLVGLAIMVVWEIGEYVAGIRESAANRLLDIVVGLLGVAGALQLAARLDAPGERIAFAAAAFAVGVGSALGWVAAHRRRKRPAPPR